MNNIGMEDTGREERERLSADDQAVQVAQDQLQAAIDAQQRRAAAAPRHVPGICSNCDAKIDPPTTAHYCDEDCRDDFERRARMAAITGRGC